VLLKLLLTAAATAAGTEAAAATAAANAATAAANAIDFSSLTTGLATLQAEVDEIQASLATAVTAADIATLQAELDGIEADVEDLLVGSGVYTTTLQITNTALLAAAKALGNGINVIAAGLNVAVTADMNMTDLQSVIDKVYNVTGNVTFTNTTAANQTPITFNKLTSATDVNLTQKGAYELKTIVSARTITLGDTYSDDVSKVHLDALTTVTNVFTGTTEDAITFDQASAIDLGSLAYYTGGNLSLTTKTGGTLDIASLTDTNSAGTLAPFTLTVAGPASLSLSKLDGDDAASTKGTIIVSKVADLTVAGFSGSIDVNNKVDNLTVTEAANLDIAGATDLESLTAEGASEFGKTWAAKTAAAKLLLLRDSALPNLTVADAADDLASVTLTGLWGAVDLSGGLANLSSVTMNAQATSLDMSNTPDLTTVNLTGSTINSVTANTTGASAMTLDYTYRATNAATAVAYGTLSVTGNLDLKTLTVNADDLGVLTVTGNTDLATISFPNLNSIGTTTAAAANIYNNDLTAVKSTDTYDATVAATAALAHTTSDTGSYDSGTSGMGGLQTYLDAIVTKGTTATNAVAFDAVTTEVVGALLTANDVTTTPGANGTWTASTLATSADNAAEHFVVLYLRADSADGETTYAGQVVGSEVFSLSYDTNRDANALADTALATDEGFDITYANGITAVEAMEGETYSGAAASSTISTITDLVNYINSESTRLYEGAGTEITASREGGEQTYYTVNYLTVTGTAGTVATASTAGYINATFGSNVKNTATTEVISMYFAAAPNEAAIAASLVTKIDALSAFNASSLATADGRANRFVVTRNVSKAGYARDISPLSPATPSLTFVTDPTSTTVQLSTNAFTSTFGTYSATRDNRAAIRNFNTTGASHGASTIVDLYVAKEQKEGLTLRVRNVGTVAFSSGVSIVPSTIGVSQSGGITQGLSTAEGLNDYNLLVDGTNIIASGSNSATSATQTTATTYWVAAFSSISDGTPSTSSSTTTAITADRTSWLS